MKQVLSFLAGALISSALLISAMFLNQDELDHSIMISIKNDTDIAITDIVITTNQKQKFTCTMRHKSCSIALIGQGDTSFEIKAINNSGNALEYSVGYAEPGSKHIIKISEFRHGST